jgi:hypothetical protein
MNTRDVSGLEQAGTLFCYHPSLTEHAWRRRYFGAARYSICGLTHTLSSDRAMRAVTELVSAPFHAWDALICPSRAIRDVTLRLIEQQQAFAVERYGARALDLPQLPVIPLAVAANDFDGLDGLRNKARQKLGIDRHDVACVYVGRLSMHAKANPAPMLMALSAQPHVPHGGKMAMLFVGWFANDRQAAFRQAAARLAPSVRVSFVDGRKANLRREAGRPPTSFYQLADNVQESFGLAPVEGMAAGLPVVVSDWDGFRDSVVDGETGFLIPPLNRRRDMPVTLRASMPKGGSITTPISDRSASSPARILMLRQRLSRHWPPILRCGSRWGPRARRASKPSMTGPW